MIGLTRSRCPCCRQWWYRRITPAERATQWLLRRPRLWQGIRTEDHYGLALLLKKMGFYSAKTYPADIKIFKIVTDVRHRYKFRRS